MKAKVCGNDQSSKKRTKCKNVGCASLCYLKMCLLYSIKTDLENLKTATPRRLSTGATVQCSYPPPTYTLREPLSIN